MAVSSVALDLSEPLPQLEAESWYGLQTRARHEKIVAHRLEERGVTAFLPLVSEEHRWSDRKKTVQVPLFSCYVFAKFAPNRIGSIARAAGGRSFRPGRRQGRGRADSRMSRSMPFEVWLKRELPWSTHPFLKIGQRVRIRSGVLNGVEGILVSRNGDRTLVISVNAIQRSLAVRVEGYEVEPA